MTMPEMKAPDRLVREIAVVTTPPLNPRGGTREQQFEQHLAMIRRWLDMVYAEGFVAGAAYWEALAAFRPHRIMVVDKETLGRISKAADDGGWAVPK